MGIVPLALAQQIDGAVHRNSIQPGADVGASLEGLALLPLPGSLPSLPLDEGPSRQLGPVLGNEPYFS